MGRFTLVERLAERLNLLPTSVYDAFPAVLFGRVLVTAVRLKIFEVIGEKPGTPGQIAELLTLPEKSISLLLPALQAGGYLRRSGETYSLTPQSAKWLLPSSHHYMGNFLAYIELLHHRWDMLDTTLRTGVPSSPYNEVFSDREWRIYTLGMAELAKLIMPHLLPKLSIPRNATQLLDLGGSHGLYSAELCKKHPSLKATIADYPEVLRHAGEILARHHLENRIILQPCDVTTTAFPPGRFDAVLAFNIIHGFDEATNERLLGSISMALRPGGIVYILDQFVPSGRNGARTLLPLMVGINLMNEIGGTTYSAEKIRGWCQRAGLAGVKHQRLFLPGVDLIRAEKKL